MSMDPNEPRGRRPADEPAPVARFAFSPRHNRIPLMVAPAVLLGPIAVIGLIWYYFSPEFTDVGYQPEQPVAYSHKLHAGDLGMDCRYCHTGVEQGPHAGVPPTQTCMNCHAQIRRDSPRLLAVRESWASGEPIPWVRVHKNPDYAFFDHSAHVQAGVGCETCHGRVDQMVEVRQVAPLSMGWCLDCHRAPEAHLRPREAVTEMGWAPPAGDRLALGRQLHQERGINPPTHCSGCHR